MYTRNLRPPQRTFFLFGPRGTGKTTWLQGEIQGAHWVNLLVERELVRFLREPGRFSLEVGALRPRRWIVVDEVQRLPALLDEVQDLIAKHPGRHRFALSGSSARKLKRGGANLLPGRAINRRFYPLTADELAGDFDLEAVLRFGCLPFVQAEKQGDSARVDLLDAYGENYITQEIRAEAIVKNLQSFSRFLEVAALANGQVTNVAGLARDAAVARPTVQGYFEVLVDTLVGTWLPAWRPRAKVKELGHPKFYFFDTGVVRAISGRLREPLTDAERGPLLETYVLHELRAWINRSGCGGELSYWRTPSGSEVDFVWTRGGAAAVGIEVKAARQWRSHDGAALAELAEQRKLRRAIAVYRGRETLRAGQIEVLPVPRFLERLGAGEVLG